MRIWLLTIRVAVAGSMIAASACEQASDGDSDREDVTSLQPDAGASDDDPGLDVADAAPAPDAPAPGTDAAPEELPPDAAPPPPPPDPCSFEGVPLYGKVRVVQNFTIGEIKVAYVSSFPDLKVKFTDFETQAVSCGIWHEDNFFYDFTIREVDPITGFPDLKIKDVTGTAEPPGL